MDIVALTAFILIVCLGSTLLVVGLLSKSKSLREKLLQDERRKIVDAIMNFRPLAASPDVRDTKNGIIDVITRRSL